MFIDENGKRHVFSDETRKKLKKRGSICMIVGLCVYGLAIAIEALGNYLS